MPRVPLYFISIERLPGGFKKVGYVGEFFDEGVQYRVYHTYYQRGDRLIARICSGELIEWVNWKEWSFQEISKQFEDLTDPYAEDWCKPESVLMQSAAHVRSYPRRKK